MTWIDDAKKIVSIRKVVTSTAEAAERRRSQDELKQIHTLFSKYAEAELLKITKVLNQAKKQGLKVSDPFEGYLMVPDGWHTYLYLERFVEGWIDHNDAYHGGDFYHNGYFDAWGIRWTISDPFRGKKYKDEQGYYRDIHMYPMDLEIVLHLKIVGDSYVPWITSSEIEEKIKEWLIQVYS